MEMQVELCVILFSSNSKSFGEAFDIFKLAPSDDINSIVSNHIDLTRTSKVISFRGQEWTVSYTVDVSESDIVRY